MTATAALSFHATTNIFLFLCGVILLQWGIEAIFDVNFALVIDYCNNSEAVNMNYLVLAQGALLTLQTLLETMMYTNLKKRFYFKNRYARTFQKIAQPFALFLCTVSILITLLFVCTIEWLVEYAHVPRLDVLFRQHDMESVCWSGVVEMDYNNVNIMKNCFVYNERMMCAQCRLEYYRGEANFFSNCRFALLFTALVMLVDLFYFWNILQSLYNPSFLHQTGKNVQSRPPPPYFDDTLSRVGINSLERFNDKISWTFNEDLTFANNTNDCKNAYENEKMLP
ncbi:arif-1 [Lambdina fiscellaria nucleopolyhedrovirus]|uniref:Arif-1 n=1 Tax=Lambdina fiscellaria nucleopolyhedrovirus TaxID=1642929 RepID=A0A0E3URP8_9ABAC|nr:arif-1 [Lambdina fiscellaria nucleopolyhedrovirus]AKC91654.1 arif-1 [Lambdina fiscellaria nucleopolyhedrovirus]